MSDNKVGRRRRSSSLLYQEPPETIEHMSDQAALPNLNANWVNAKGQRFSSFDGPEWEERLIARHFYYMDADYVDFSSC